MILGQLRMGARQAKNAPLAMVTVLLPTIRITKIHYDDHTTKMIIYHAYPHHNQDDHKAAGEGRRQTHLARPS